MLYLVKMKPMEPYAFGTERGFAYEGIDNAGKETYYTDSNQMPEQTTILGMLRYITLEQKGLLKSDYEYVSDDKEKMKVAIGEKSFSFDASEAQDFGNIKSVSPVFLMDKKNHIYVKNPFHNKSDKDAFQGMQMTAAVYETSSGTISLPESGEFDAKKGYGTGFYELTEKKLYAEDEKPIFSSVVQVGNRKNGKVGNSDDDCFFKKEKIVMNDDFCFAVYVEADKLPEKTPAFMGQKKSSFLVTTEEMNNEKDSDGNVIVSMEELLKEKLDKKVKEAFASDQIWYYALSDIVIPEGQEISYPQFCIIEKKQVRNLKTVYDEKRQSRRLKRTERQLNLITKGSVFYEKCPLPTDSENCKKIGYNRIIKIGGTDK